MTNQFYLGCAVWAFKGWSGEFYPPKTQPADFLPLYVKRLNAVEGNTTFYAVPSDENMQRWHDAMPESFRFCPKLFKGYTHNGELMPYQRDLMSLRERLAFFGKQLGPVMLQLPPSYGPDRFNDLSTFLEQWPTEQTPLAVELRHRSWWQAPHDEALYRLFEAQNVTRILLDTRPVYDCSDDPQYLSERRKPELPVTYETTNDTVLIRYIGHPNLDFNRPYLDAWADHIELWWSQGKTIYFFAHCPQEEHSPFIARSMHRILTRRGLEIGPLGWDAVKDYPKQLGLF